MASKNTKTKIKTGLDTLTAHTLTLKFHAVLKDSSELNTIVNGTKLTTNAVFTLKITKLKGFQHSQAFQKMLADPLAPYYKTSYIMISSRGETEIKTSLSTLTDGHNLYNWLLTNAVKLYMLPNESKTTILRDRNYSEICGRSQFADKKDWHKAYINYQMTKSIKTDIKEIGVMIEMIVEKDIVHTPGRTLKTEMQKFFQPGQIDKWKQAKKLEKAGTKQITNK